MPAYSNYALRVPSSLMDDLRVAADRDGVSMNSFIVQSVAEKVAALRVRGLLHELTAEEQLAYFKERASRAGSNDMAEILATTGTTGAVLPGDELPVEWLSEHIPPL